MYKPFDLEALGDWENGDFGYNLNDNAQYVVIQNEIEYVIDSSGEFFPEVLTNRGWAHIYDGFDEELIKELGIKRVKKEDVNKIESFRPNVDIDKEKILYLTKDYEDTIKYFLGKCSVPMEEGVKKRYEELRKYFPILPAHDGGYWHISTHPSISRILFNKDINRAACSMRVGFKHGIVELKKEDGVWKIIRTGIIGIE